MVVTLVAPVVLMDVQAPLGGGFGGMEVLAMAEVLANGRSAGNGRGTGNGCVDGGTGTKLPWW